MNKRFRKGPKLAVDDRFEKLTLRNQLCFALYAATHAITRTYRERLDPIGITYPQYLVLIVLWEKNGVSMTEICNALMLDSGTLTPVVKRLEAQGLVQRKRRKTDERSVEVWLTRKGINLRELVLGARDHVVCRLDMSEDDILTLRKDLMALIDKLDGERCDVVSTAAAKQEVS